MASKRNIHPPRWAENFLSWYCRPELLEDLQGDLNEYFHRNVEAKGAAKARFIYILDVLKFLRLYTIRKPEFINLLLQWIMLGSYIKTSGRSIMRNKLFSVINIVGLSISMAVGLLMIGILSDTLSYDKFHTNHEKIYRVISHYEHLGKKDDNRMATTSLVAGKEISENVTGIENTVIFNRELFGDFIYKEKSVPLNGLWTENSFFEVFSFNLISGNPKEALKEPFSLVLTKSSASKIFGDEDAMGKTVTWLDETYTVTGILEDLPQFSHLKFDMLASLATREILYKDRTDEYAWDNIWNFYAYIKVAEDANMETLQDQLNALSAKNDATLEHTKIHLALQPITDIVLGEDLGNQTGPTLGRTTLWIFIAITVIVILSACFNYTNLSIARSMRRSREVGIRKIIGAVRSQVIGQFVVEAVIISLTSLALAFGLFLLLRPHLLSLQYDLQQILALNLSLELIVYFIAFAVMIGVVAGLFPALFFANVNAVKVLKDITATKLFRKVTMRKALIVFQYTISIIFITSTLIIYQQYKHFVSFDLGFSTENILNINLQRNKADVLLQQLSELHEVKEISRSMMIPGVGNYWGISVKNPHDPADSANMHYNTIDENYIPLHDHTLIAGRNFNPKRDSSAETEVLVNEQLLKRFKLGTGAEALGEELQIYGKKVTIVGVMKDFTYGRANSTEKSEVVFRYSSNPGKYLNLKIQSTDWPSTHSRIESIWEKIDPVHPLDAKFYKEKLEESYSGLSASLKLAGFLAVLAICIASLGLLGMVVFTTETRLKEVSLRKVLGAGEANLIYLLGKGFFAMLLIASLIALPVTYLFWDRIMLVQMANHLPIGLLEMLLGVTVIMIIAAIMIGSQTFKVARTNPAEVLKNE